MHGESEINVVLSVLALLIIVVCVVGSLYAYAEGVR